MTKLCGVRWRRPGEDGHDHTSVAHVVTLRSHKPTAQSNHDLHEHGEKPYSAVHYDRGSQQRVSSSQSNSKILNQITPQSLFLSRRMPRRKRRRGYLSQHARSIGKVRRRSQEDMHNIIQISQYNSREGRSKRITPVVFDRH